MQLTTDKPGERPVIWEWMHRKTKLPWSSDLRTIAVMRDDGTIAAAVGFNSWTHEGCWMHVAFDGAHSMTRELMRAAFKYPFQDCGKSAVYALPDKDNDEALRFIPKMGFKELTRTVDCVMFEMKAEDCRWIKEKEHGREIVSTSST
jgi:RimJ/RimL family protein N-acetyltransferase